MRKDSWVLLLIIYLMVGTVWAENSPKDAQSLEQRWPSTHLLGNVPIPDPSAGRASDPFGLLHDRPMAESALLVPQLIASVNTLSPQYLYELARRLWPTEQSKAMEWLVVGMARARYDALRCVDKSAREGIGFLGAIAPDVMTGIKEKRKAFSEAGRRALARADLYSDAVSPAWICGHGIQAISMALEGKKANQRDWLTSSAEWEGVKSAVSTELARYLDEQEMLPNEPPQSNQETLVNRISTVTNTASARLDQAFGQRGTFKMSIESKSIYAKDALVQPDGKIVVVVGLSDKSYRESAALVRLKPDGTLDKQFGIGGVVSAKLGVTTRYEKIALLPNGKIVVTGWAYVSSVKNGALMARYNANGNLDEGFADQGVLFFAQGLEASIQVLATDDHENITAGGTITIRKQHSNGMFVSSVPHENFFLARINKRGVLDASFGEKGLVATDVGGGGKVLSLTIQPDGKIVAAGTARRGTASSVIVAHYNEGGALNRGAGRDGFGVLNAQDMRYALSKIYMLSDGKLLVSHVAGNELFLSKIFSDGQLDTAFANGGQRKLAMGLLKYATTPLMTEDGRITVSGMVVRPPAEGKKQPPYHYSFGLLRFLPDGSQDNAYGADGMQVLPIGALSDNVTTLMQKRNGHILLIGHSSEEPQDSQLVLLGLVP